MIIFIKIDMFIKYFMLKYSIGPYFCSKISIRSIFLKMCNNYVHSVSMVVTVLRMCHMPAPHFLDFFFKFSF